MSLVAILGAGPIGAATAHRLAQRGRVAGLRLIDANGAAAAGKVLDIRQSGPIERFDTPLASTDDVLAASSAAVIVIADAIDDGEWSGPRGLELVQRLIRAGSRAALVFAGVRQHALMEACATELGVPLSRMVGTSASAMVGAAQAMTAIELDLSAVDLVVVGRPPAF